MEKEYFISGFCRSQNQTRTVTLSLSMENGRTEEETDCSYGSCLHEGSCEIAREIKEREEAFPVQTLQTDRMT